MSSHIRINNDFMRTPEFIEFHSRCHGTNYYFLESGIVRELNSSTDYSKGMNYIYAQHYMKGELVARYSQVDMAKYLKSDQSRISKNMVKLSDMGLVKKMYKNCPKGRMLFYQLGTWEGTLGDKKSYKETLFGDEIFKGYAVVAKQKRGEKKPHKVSGSLVEFSRQFLDPDHPEYDRLSSDWECKL